MPAILRKIRTAGRMLFSPGGLQRVREATRANLRERRVARAKGQPFHYTLRTGMPFVCIPDSKTSVHTFVADLGYEEIELDICRRWLKPGDGCMDIGANIGLVAAAFSQAVGPNGCVVAIEPAPNTHRHMTRAIGLLNLTGVVRPEAVCVSDAPGHVTFMAAKQDGLDETASMKIDPSRAQGFTEVTVPAVTIDSLIEKHGLAGRLSLIKIDIEGAEPLALRGAAKLFASGNLPLFVVEVHTVAMKNFNHQPMDILRHFPAADFELFHVQRSRTDLTPAFEFGRLYPLPDPAGHRWPYYSNVIAVPRRGPFAARRSQIAGLLPR